MDIDEGAGVHALVWRPSFAGSICHETRGSNAPVRLLGFNTWIFGSHMVAPESPSKPG